MAKKLMWSTWALHGEKGDVDNLGNIYVRMCAYDCKAKELMCLTLALHGENVDVNNLGGVCVNICMRDCASRGVDNT